ncbi:MAG: 3-hydroxyacyl-CoA dehydrogenase [Bacteroidetes bacterium CHB5]|nr:3-hydroxyacyl-CoA dehydrogenase [Bacteroidetes bacterium CHB5]
MKILVIGTEENCLECKQKFGDAHHYSTVENTKDGAPQLAWAEVVFDFLPIPEAFDLAMYKHANQPVFLNSTFSTLSGLIATYSGKATFIGFCGMPTFLNRQVLEVCVANADAKVVLEDTCKKLNTSFGLVADQVGFVTPRIICMIINEAYCTVEEGTASREDIDVAMKLGTNYPYGPFEWAERIGKKNVVALLKSVQQATGDLRYAVCKLLEH